MHLNFFSRISLIQVVIIAMTAMLAGLFMPSRMVGALFTKNTGIVRRSLLHSVYTTSSPVNKQFMQPVCNRSIRLSSAMSNDDGSFSEANMEKKGPIKPSRNDLCKILISGIIGVDPKERYLSNGHYVLSFSVAVTGHYEAIHNWEESRPAETMWLNAEVWDDQARDNIVNLKRGSKISGVGYLIHNKWVDKATGEERKQFKLRFTKFLPIELLKEIIDTNDLSHPIMQSRNSFDDFN